MEHLYAHLTVERCADLKAIDSDSNSDGNSDSNGDIDIDRSCVDSSHGVMAVDDAPSKKELIEVPLEELRNCSTAKEAFDLAMDYPCEQVEERFWQLKLGTKRVE
eukprot:795931-Ditylum_brightwellii.AAC.1